MAMADDNGAVLVLGKLTDEIKQKRLSMAKGFALAKPLSSLRSRLHESRSGAR